jgi:hypothetical protein
MLENVRPKITFVTPGKVFNIDRIGIQINNKPNYVITKGSKSVHALISGEMIENITEIVLCIAGQFPPHVLIVKVVNKNQEFSDDLHPGSDMYMNRKSWYISTGFPSAYRASPQTHVRGKAFLLLDGHRARCSLHETAVENNVTTIRLSHSART